MRVLVLPDQPLGLPAGAERLSGVHSLEIVPDVVVLKGAPGFADLALAYSAQLRGSLVLAVGPIADLPEAICLDEDLPASATPEMEGRAVERLARLRDLEKVTLALTALYDDAGPAEPEGSEERVHEVHAALHARLHEQSERLRQALDRATLLYASLETEHSLRVNVEARLALLGRALDDVADAVCVTDPSGRVLSVNRSFLAPEPGLSRMDVENRPLEFFFQPAEADGESIADLIAATARGTHETSLFRRRLSDGRVLRYAASFTRVRHTESPEDRVVAIFRDTTDHDALMARVVQVERLSALGRLAAGVAHEINNPLAYVVATLEVLASRLGPEVLARLFAEGTPDERGEPHRLVGTALDGCRRIATVVADLKQLTRAQAERREVVDLRGVVEFALRVGANDLRHRARVEVRTEDVPPVLGNEARLGQVFINLLYNAIQAMQTGNADAHAITVQVYAPALGEVAVSVQDNGAGISPENLDRIFEPFFTTKGRGRGEGTGLGLAICRDIIESHGGRIEITSTVGVGTTVRVLLPAHGVTTSPPAPAPPVEREAPLPERVLIVDDEPHLRDSLAWLLDPIDCRTAGSIQEAQLELSTEDFGAVLCDLQMPTGLGTELLAWVRVHRPALSPRFAVMTGGALSREARVAIDASGVPVLEKPFTRDAVFALLRKMQG